MPSVTLKREVRPKNTFVVTDEHREKLLDTALAILATGVYPTVRVIMRAAPGITVERCKDIRREWVEAGIFPPHRSQNSDGLTGKDAAELAEIRERYLEVKAEKVKAEERLRFLKLNTRPMFDVRPLPSLATVHHLREIPISRPAWRKRRLRVAESEWVVNRQKAGRS